MLLDTYTIIFKKLSLEVSGSQRHLHIQYWYFKGRLYLQGSNIHLLSAPVVPGDVPDIALSILVSELSSVFPVVASTVLVAVMVSDEWLSVDILIVVSVFTEIFVVSVVFTKSPSVVVVPVIIVCASESPFVAVVSVVTVCVSESPSVVVVSVVVTCASEYSAVEVLPKDDASESTVDVTDVASAVLVAVTVSDVWSSVDISVGLVVSVVVEVFVVSAVISKSTPVGSQPTAPGPQLSAFPSATVAVTVVVSVVVSVVVVSSLSSGKK